MRARYAGRVRGRSIASACALAALSACLATTDLDALRANRDGGATGGDAAPTSDAAAGDGAPGALGCAGVTALLCADFDQGDVRDGWDDVEQVGGGTATFDTVHVRSPARSMSAHTPAIDGSSVSAAKARLSKAFAPTVSTAHLALDVFVDAVDPSDASGELATITFASGGHRYTIYLVLRSSGDELLEYYPDADGGSLLNRFPLRPQLARGAFSHVEIDVSLTNARADVTIGGVSALSNALAPPYAGGTPEISIGLSVSGASSDFRVELDDVVFDAH